MAADLTKPNSTAPPSYTSGKKLRIKLPAHGSTIDSKPNPIWNLAKEIKYHSKPSNCGDVVLKVCRVLMHGFLFVMVLGTGLWATLIFLSMMTQLTQSDDSVKETMAIDLVVCSGFYAGLSLVVCAWRLCVNHKTELNKFGALKMIGLELVSAVGEYILLFRVLAQVDSPVAMLVMPALSILPSLAQLIHFVGSLWTRPSRVCSRNCASALIAIGSVLPFMLQTGALGYLVYIMLRVGYLSDGKVSEITYMLPVAIILKSASFLENFWARNGNREPKAKVQDNNETNRQISQVSSSSDTSTDDQPSSSGGSNLRTEAANETLLNALRSLVKVVLAVTVIILLRMPDVFRIILGPGTDATGLFGNQGASTAFQNRNVIATGEDWDMVEWKGLGNWLIDVYEVHTLAIHLLVMSVLFPYFASLSCRLYMQRVAFCVPLVLILPSTWTIVSLSCLNKDVANAVNAMGCGFTCSYSEVGWRFYELTGVGIVLWLATLAITWYIWYPNVERMARVDRLFTLPLRDVLYPVLNVLLRRKKDKHVSQPDDVGTQNTEIPQVKICVTMWHETAAEMLQLLLSLFKLDKFVRARSSLAEKLKNDPVKEDTYTTDKLNRDKINITIHVVVDNAFEYTKRGRVLNEHSLRFIACLKKAGRTFLGDKRGNAWVDLLKTSGKSSAKYGGRLVFILPGGTRMILHLKDKQKIRIKKRWSQVMYMYYCLLFGHTDVSKKSVKQRLRNTYILTLDGDVDFEPRSVLLLMDRMKKSAQVGAVCGRIHPIGSGAMIWYQQFEYAVGHWLQKASEHVFGCVLCCPGCFSLFRASALVDDNVLKTYARAPERGSHLLQFEQGEDRWLCTLLLKCGYKIDYCAGADAKTFAPEDFMSFFIQRRRWSPSTIANMIDLLCSWREIVRMNNQINHAFMFYQCVLLLTSLLSPATVIVLITGSFSAVLQLGVWHSFLVAVTPVVIFAISCFTCKQDKQLLLAALFSTVYTFVMVFVTIGTLLNIVSEDVLSPNVMFLAFLAAVFVMSAFMHPREFTCLFSGLLYYVVVPSTFIFLTVYFVCNLNDVSWGTREKKEASIDGKKPPEPSVFALVLDCVKSYAKDVRDKYKQDPDVECNNTPKVTETLELRVVYEDDLWLEEHEEVESFGKLDISNEDEFWDEKLKQFLGPLSDTKDLQKLFDEELVDLRNRCVHGFFTVNLMIALSLIQLQVSRDELKPFYIMGKYEPFSVLLLAVFGAIVLVQVLGMLVHRWGTFLHLISATKFSSEIDQEWLSEFDALPATGSGKSRGSRTPKTAPTSPTPDYDDSSSDESAPYSQYNYYDQCVDSFIQRTIHSRQRVPQGGSYSHGQDLRNVYDNNFDRAPKYNNSTLGGHVYDGPFPRYRDEVV